jgi:hypothetical protein
MDWLAYPLRDLLVWSFENIFEPLGNYPNMFFFFLILGGAAYWMLVQHKMNKVAENNPEQIK